MLNVPELTVAEFSRSVKRVVEDAFGYVRIKGEISGFKRASSGHLYFNLKDEEALLNAVCFKNMADLINFEVADGLQIIASGRVSTFAGRSNYQIVVEKVEVAGIGAILAMIEKRRQKLAAEGLFDAEHKKPLPFFPQIIGVITSETGAVIQDIIHRVEARCPTHLLVYPSAMQGKEAVKSVIQALRYFNKLPKFDQESYKKLTKNQESQKELANLATKKFRPDLIIIARGGGSFEDLLPFNDEDLVREVFKSEIPIISAVGHETDTTLIDFVADLRAPTPTAAAELATPVLSDLENQLKYCEQRLSSVAARALADKKIQLENLQKHIIHPAKTLQHIIEKLNFTEQKLSGAITKIIEKNQQKINLTAISLLPILHKINFAEQKIITMAGSLKSSATAFFKNSEIELENLGKLLKSGHYQEILKRGFALIKNERGTLISSVQQIKIKEEIGIEMSDGEFHSYVLSCKKKSYEEAIKPSESIQRRLI